MAAVKDEIEKRPRHYAFEISQERTLEKRRAKLEQVPKNWRSLVESHLRIMWEKREANKARAGVK